MLRRISAGSSGNTVGNDLNREITGKRGAVGSFVNQYLKYVQAIWDTSGTVAG